MPPILDFLNVPSAVARVLHDCRAYDSPDSISAAVVFKPESRPRKVLEQDVRDRLRSGSFGMAPTSFLVPKGPATTRIFTMPELVDQIIYQALADWLAPHARSLEHPDVPSLKSERSDWRVKGWIVFQEELVKTATAYGWVGLSDLADFFETIPQRGLSEKIASEFTHITSSGAELCKVRDGLEFILGRWLPTGRGIPQGPQPSFFFADVFLLKSDRLLREAGVRQMRWVDDRHFLAGSYQDAQRACRLSERLDRNDSLIRSSQKARVVSADDFVEEWKHDQTAYQEYWERERYLTTRQLLDYVIGRLSEASESHSHHVMRFLLNRAADILCHFAIQTYQAGRLVTLFRGNAVTAPQHLGHWWQPLYHLARRVEVQEACVELIQSQSLVDDTSTAWMYESFLHVDIEPGLLPDLQQPIARDCCRSEACSSLRGKALITAARYNLAGWDTLLPAAQAECPELRRYQAVASQAVPKKHRAKWVGRLSKHCGSATESAFVEHFQHRLEPIWVTPLHERRQPGGYR